MKHGMTFSGKRSSQLRKHSGGQCTKIGSGAQETERSNYFLGRGAGGGRCTGWGSQTCRIA